MYAAIFGGNFFDEDFAVTKNWFTFVLPNEAAGLDTWLNE